MTIDVVDPSKLMSMDEINESFRQSVIREQLENEQENSSEYD